MGIKNLFNVYVTTSGMSGLRSGSSLGGATAPPAWSGPERVAGLSSGSEGRNLHMPRKNPFSILGKLQEQKIKRAPEERRFQHANEVGVGIFVTRQSFATFPAASGVVIMIWKVLGAVFPELSESKLVPLITALVVGLLVYSISEKNETTLKTKIEGIAIAIVNSFSLAATAMGIDTVV